MKTALATASDNADTEFYRQLSRDDFLPDAYQIMTGFRGIIPGFKTQMDAWETYAEEFVYSHLEDFYAFMDLRLSAMTFENPLFYVEASDTSISETFSDLYYDEIYAFWASCVENLDEFPSNDILNQYTNWIVSHDLLNDTQTPLIERINIREYMAKHLTDLYLDLLATEEELFRTTPDAYGDETARKVFRTY